MSLALLHFDGHGGGGSRFRFDIGRNRYYRYAVGRRLSRGAGGFNVLADPSYESELVGPLPEHTRGRGLLTVPASAFDRENRTVQLLSFREQDLTGPAISDPVSVPPGWGSDERPALQFARGGTVSAPRAMETVPMQMREARYSNAMFLGALAGILPTLLPKVAPFLGGLLGGAGGGGDGGGAPSAVGRAVGDPKLVNLLAELLQQVGKATGGGVAAVPTTAAPAPPVVGVAPAPDKKKPPEAKSMALGGRGPYSRAQVAPALLAALPALAPLLKQILSPETIKNVLDSPAKLAQVPINAFKDLAKLGLQSHEQDLRHLRAIHPGIDDPALDALLQSLSMASSAAPGELVYRRVSSVSVDFAGVVPHDVYGATKVLYKAGSALTFPLTVETPRTISNAMVELVVKDASSLEVLARSRRRIEGPVTSGRLQVAPSLAEERAAKLGSGRRLVVGASLVWRSSKGGLRGTSRQQLVELVAEHVFDRVEEATTLTPLADADRDREFWHRIWQGAFDGDVKRFEIACRYYYVLNPKRAENARIETAVRLDRGDRRATGKLKSGMELSPTALNRIIPRLAPDRQPLDEPELAALRSDDFVERFNQAARYNAKLRGRSGDTASLWVYPEMKLQTVVLQRAAQVDPNGQVTALDEHRVVFPMPSTVHFIGARTT